MAQPDENEAHICLKRVRDARDEAALARLYDLYSGTVYRVCLLILKAEAEAEEVLQDVFLHIWERSAGFDATRGKLYTWVCLLARSKAIDRSRKKQRQLKHVTLTAEGDLEPVIGQAEASTKNALSAVLDDERRRQVLGLLARLSPAQSEALRLAYYEGLSQSEIASRLKLPIGTVKTRLRLGLQRLSSMMTEEQRQWL